MSEVLLPSFYLPNIEYMRMLLQYGQAKIEVHDHFQKQTFRNRCYIAGANGRQALIVPIQGRNKKQETKDVKISYEENWVRIHWNALTSAYRSSPFFDYFDVEMEKILYGKPVFLLDLNMNLMDLVLKKLKMSVPLITTESFEAESTLIDKRESFSAKKNTLSNYPEYRQVFMEKNGFISNLSVIDLMANKLTRAKDYLFEG